MAKGYKQIGTGPKGAPLYRNIKAGSPRKGQVFRKGKDGSHIYAGGVRIGGKNAKKPASKKAKKAPKALDFLQPLTDPKLFREEMRAAQRLEFGDLTRQIQSERRISDQQLANTDAWFGQYRAAVERSRQQALAAYNAAAQATQAAGQAAFDQSSQQNAQLNQQAAQQAALRGATPDPAMAQIAAQAAQSRLGTANAQAGLTRTLGANVNAELASRAANAEGQRVSALRDEQGNRRLVEQAARDLAAKKGAFRTDFRRKAREEERKYALERQAFELDVAKLREDARQAAADRRIRIRGQNITKRGQTINARTQRRGQDMTDARVRDSWRQKGKGKNGKLTPAQRVRYRDNYRSLVADMKRRIAKGAKPARLYREATKNGAPPLVAQVALMRARGLAVPQHMRRKMKRDYGISIPGSGGMIPSR